MTAPSLVVDLSRIKAVISAEANVPRVGCYGTLEIAEASKTATGQRLITVTGSIREVVIFLRLFSMDDEARSLLVSCGLPRELYFSPEGRT